jgi:hypothetical protein
VQWRVEAGGWDIWGLREPESPGPLKWAPKWTPMAAPWRPARRQTTAGESPPAGAQAATDVRRESKIVLVMHDAERFSIICHIGQVADVLGLSMYNFAGLQFHANEI